MNINMNMSIHMNMHMYMYMYMSIMIYIFTYVHIYTHIHMYMHAAKTSQRRTWRIIRNMCRETSAGIRAHNPAHRKGICSTFVPLVSARGHIYIYMCVKVVLPLEDFMASVYQTAARIKIRETHAILAMTKHTGFVVC